MAKNTFKYYTTRKYNSKIHVFEFIDSWNDMNYVLAVGDTSKRQKLSAIENSSFINQGYKAVAKINAGFFYGSVSNALGSIGLAAFNYGAEHYGDETPYGENINRQEAYYKDGKLMLERTNSWDYDWKYKPHSYWGCTLSYALVKDGVKNLEGVDNYTSISGRNPRTLIGQKEDGTHVWVVAEGRNINSSVGLTADESADLMVELGCINAVNCDGGGSSEMIVDGVIKNTPTDGSERSIATAFIVYAKDYEIVGNDDSNSGSGSTPEAPAGYKKLVLDAGHGYHTEGKRTPDDIREWWLNNNVCNYVQEKLKGYNITIYRTDDITGETDVALSTRVAKTNEISPDLFISVHHNANTSQWGDWTGTEVYWHTHGSTEDQKVANILAPKISAHTGLTNRGVKQASFAVLGCNSHIPAVLCEGGFMDSRIDHPVITTWGQEAYADALVEGIKEYLGITKVEEDVQPELEDTPVHDSKLYYSNGQSKVYVELVGENPINVRSGRGTEHDIIGTLPSGTKIMINYILADNRDGQGDDALWGSIDYTTTYAMNSKAVVTGYIHLGFAIPTEEEDKTPPVVTLNGDAEIRLNRYEEYVELGATAQDEKDGPCVVNIIGSVNTNNVGSQSIRYQASDTKGNIGEAVRTVIVGEDIIPPSLTLNGQMTIRIPVFNNYEEPGYVTSDNTDQEVTVLVTSEPELDTNKIGTYTLTYTATDVDNLTAVKTRTIIVYDDVSPEITLNGDNYVVIEQGEEYIELGATAIDNYDEHVEVIIDGKVNTDEIGDQYIFYKAIDSSYNEGSTMRTVSVIERIVTEPEPVPNPFEPGKYGKEVIVDAETLNVYSSCSESSTVKAQLINSEIIRVSHIFNENFDKTNNSSSLWGAIETNCKAGYINLKYCSELV